jgi:hypothetical protein
MENGAELSKLEPGQVCDYSQIWQTYDPWPDLERLTGQSIINTKRFHKFIAQSILL